MKELVTIDKLQKKFCKDGVCIADNINLSIKEGEIFTILGKSGSGKTTFLRMIAGIETPDGGEIMIDNQIVFSKKINISPNRRGIAVVFQNYALLPHLTVASNITFGGKFSNNELNDILIKTNLLDEKNKFPHEISGGQQQRVALARALIHKPKILLLDEPLSNIDTELRAILRTELKEMIKKFNITALFITHDKEDAFFLSDRIAIMDRGQILQIGTPIEIYENPIDLYTANFLGKITKIDNDSYIRPEQIHISSNGEFNAVVTNVIFYGAFYEFSLAYGCLELTAQANQAKVNIGETIRFNIIGKLLLFNNS